ncbi:MAG: hypothetical protein U9R47_09285 [Actinomycetota bacterium]|nr:hypothetical protein [Actinomycetota bacterium]
MILKRLFPARWAKILAWTGASLAWGTTLIAVAANATATDVAEQPDSPVAIDPPTTTSVSTTTTAPMPDMPERGLVVVRYTPVPPPPPQVVTRTVVVAGSSGGGGGSAVTASPASPTAAAPAVSAPVKSSGS